MAKKDTQQVTQEVQNDQEEMVVQEQPTYEELMQRVQELESQVEAAKTKSGGRKQEVLNVLKESGHIRVSDIAKKLGISDRNVSSQLSYLRKDGWRIATDSRGLKFIETEPEPKEVE